MGGRVFQHGEDVTVLRTISKENHMSINAIVRRVQPMPDGKVLLFLSPFNGDGPGQNSLMVDNPPGRMDGLIGTHIWGGARQIMVGTTKIADRVGYRHIHMVGRPPA
jgi:hypothetical protein